MLTESCYKNITYADISNGVHLMGIAGVGMTALAEILLDKGIKVTGSDIATNSNVKNLVQRGVTFYLGHKKSYGENKFICRSRTIKDDNIELQGAKKVVYRSCLLAFLAKDYRQIVITGSHGKTTTSCLLAHCMKYLGMDISFALGGISPSLGCFGKIGKSPYFIIEGDESDGSHLKTNPFGAILTSCDVDHLAFWKKEENLRRSYLEFVSMVQEKEKFFYYGADPFLSSKAIEGRTYGIDGPFEYSASDIGISLKKATFHIRNQPLILPMFGKYNIKNALAVYGMLETFGFNHQEISSALHAFLGVHRRMEYIGNNIFSDYAHHPEEVKSVLEAVSACNIPLKVIFEPHRLSRFRDELDGFCEVFNEVIITDVFEASEQMAVDSRPLIDQFCKKTNSVYMPLEEIEIFLQNCKGELLLLGAGILDKKVRKICEK